MLRLLVYGWAMLMCIFSAMGHASDAQWGLLCNWAQGFWSNFLAESTSASVRSQMVSFLLFCEFYGLIPCPPDEGTLILYVFTLAVTMRYSSIKKYLNGVRIFCANWNHKVVWRN